jgi:tetratricopeptide (TPR) repeat protein
LSEQGEYAAARPLLERALAICERTLGPDHPATATSLNNLALLLYRQGEYAAARPLYERALAIRKRTLGPDHPQTRQARDRLRKLYTGKSSTTSFFKRLTQQACDLLRKLRG